MEAHVDVRRLHRTKVASSAGREPPMRSHQWTVSGCSAPASSEPTPWANCMTSGQDAYQHGRYPEAEAQFFSAIRMAERPGPADSRLAASLLALARVYQAQAKYALAEPIYQ